MMILGALAAAATLPAQGLLEGFENVAALESAGWRLINHSEPLGSTHWAQGSSGNFSALAGSASSYLAANYNNTASNGTISNWALTPVVPLTPGAELTFYTRTLVSPTEFPDRLWVMMSLEGESTDIGTTAVQLGDFIWLLEQINPDLTATGYPSTWTEYSIELSAFAVGKPGRMGRFGFRYYVTDSGPSGTNGDYIGIDSVSYETDGVFFGDFESGDMTAWTDTVRPNVAAGSKTLFDGDSFDFLTGAVGNVTGGDLYVTDSYVGCDGGPATFANNLEQGEGLFLNDYGAPLASYEAPAGGLYTSQAVCLHEGGVYVYQLETPAGRDAFFRVTDIGAAPFSVTFDYQVR